MRQKCNGSLVYLVYKWYLLGFLRALVPPRARDLTGDGPFRVFQERTFCWIIFWAAFFGGSGMAVAVPGDTETSQFCRGLSFKDVCRQYPDGWVLLREGEACGSGDRRIQEGPRGWKLSDGPYPETEIFQVTQNPYIRSAEDVGTFFPRRTLSSRAPVSLDTLCVTVCSNWAGVLGWGDDKTFLYSFDFLVDSGGIYCFLPDTERLEDRGALLKLLHSIDERLKTGCEEKVAGGIIVAVVSERCWKEQEGYCAKIGQNLKMVNAKQF